MPIMPTVHPFGLPQAPAAPGTRCTLLLGTDTHIEEGTPNHESRVAVVPEQVAALRAWLAEAGVECTVLVVAGAGERAGFADADFERAGARIVPEAELPSIAPPDVVHALKEPCAYEATIPGPFLRIGALHTGDTLGPENGSVQLLCSRRACAVFDGSEIGGNAFRFQNPPGFPIPIRSSMSVFAGEIAAADVVTHLDGREGRCVIAGGGAAGTAATDWLLRESPRARVTIMEAVPQTAERLRGRYSSQPRVEIVDGSWMTREMLAGAGAVILAVFTSADEAPKVVGLSELAHLAEGARIIDISIDEGGAIDEGKNKAELIAALGRGYSYEATKNLPTRRAPEASRAHGNAVLPYLGVLLHLSATQGGGANALAHLDPRLPQMPHAVAPPDDLFSALVQDLRQGTAFWGIEAVHVNRDVVRQWERYEELLREAGVPLTAQEPAML
jgi:alanine dehydrogenase